MPAWATIRRFGAAGVLSLVALALPSPSASGAPEPKPGRPAKPTSAQLRDVAEKAEKGGDWEAAFNAYCLLFVADRSTPGVREKLNAALRHTQQLRRHRDPGYQQFVAVMTVDAGLDLFAEVFQKLLGTYADRDRATPQNLWSFAVEELDRALGNPVFRQTFLDNPRPDRVEPFRTALRQQWAKRVVADHAEARGALRRLIAAAQDHFALKAPAALALEAASGACSGLDEYTVLLTPSAGSEAAAPDLVAAGLYLAAAKDALVVEGIAPNSWVALNYPQLRRGDRVTRVNGRAIDAPGTVAGALRTPIEGAHHLDVRGSEDEVKFQARIPVQLPSVYGTRMLPDRPVGYTRIGHFQASTPRDLDVAVAALKDAGARALVIDLRGNHGGSFLAGVETAKRLLANGLIVTTQGQVSEVANQAFSSSSGMSAHDIPLVVLIDGDTASAAEVLAAALKDNNRATLVGMSSFGKGTVQTPLRLVALDDIDPATGKPGKVSKTGTVRVTIAKLVAPAGGAISGTGVGPHLVESDPTLQLELAAEKAEELATGQTLPLMPMPHPMLPMIP